MAYPEKIDENAARLTAGFVLALALTTFVLQAWWFLPVLAAGFVVRATLGPRYSPLALFAGKVVAPALKLSPRPTWATPKRFAQGCGIVFTVAASVSALVAKSYVATGLILSVLALCAGLESIVGFCVGCRVYDFVGPIYERARLKLGRG